MSIVLMVIGAFGPWAKVFGIAGVSGVDGDGWAVIAAAAASLGMMYLHLRRPARPLWPLVVAGLLGVGASVVAIADLTDVIGVQNGGSGDESGLFGKTDLVTPGWGIWVASLASISLAVSSAALFIRGGEPI